MKTLYCFYDMAVSPCSYDFFTFLYSAEICRLRRRKSEIKLVIIQGPNNRFRQDNIRTSQQNEIFFNNVIVPGISILPSCTSFSWSDRNDLHSMTIPIDCMYPRGYSIPQPISEYTGRELTASKIRQDIPGCFKAPDYAKQLVSSFVNEQLNGQKYVTITAREILRDNVNNTRTLDQNVWQNVITELEKRNIRTVLVRDTNHAHSTQKLLYDVIESPEAAIHLPFRMALYEGATVNFCKNNGPGVLQLFSKNTNMYFNEFDPDVIALSPTWFEKNYGMVEGSQLPMSRNCNVYKWGEEIESDILEFFYKTMDNQIDTSPNYSFNNEENLIKSVEVALGVLCTNIAYNILEEDIILFECLSKLATIFNFKQSIVETMEGQTGTILPSTKLDEFLNKVREVGLLD